MDFRIGTPFDWLTFAATAYFILWRAWCNSLGIAIPRAGQRVNCLPEKTFYDAHSDNHFPRLQTREKNEEKMATRSLVIQCNNKSRFTPEISLR